jgi:hypothetical protein
MLNKKYLSKLSFTKFFANFKITLFDITFKTIVCIWNSLSITHRSNIIVTSWGSEVIVWVAISRIVISTIIISWIIVRRIVVCRVVICWIGTWSICICTITWRRSIIIIFIFREGRCWNLIIISCWISINICSSIIVIIWIVWSCISS